MITLREAQQTLAYVSNRPSIAAYYKVYAES